MGRIEITAEAVFEQFRTLHERLKTNERRLEKLEQQVEKLRHPEAKQSPGKREGA